MNKLFRFLVLMTAISMNSFSVISTFFERVLHIPFYDAYYPTMIFFSLFTVTLYVIKIVQSNKINFSFFYLLILTLILIVSFILSSFNHTELVRKNFFLYFLWSFPAAIAGLIAVNYTKKVVDQFFKIVFIITTICLTFIILLPYLSGTLPSYINFGLLIYQNISYIAAFMTGLGLYFIFDDSTKYKFIYFISILMLIPIILIAGGRGGAILLILYFLFTITRIMFSKKFTLIYKFLILAISCLAVFIFSLSIGMIDKEGRTFSYITEEGIVFDNSTTSNREDVYTLGINAIDKNPYIGHGFFNYYQFIGNVPHNIILEILLISGWLGLIIFSILLVYLIINFTKKMTINSPDLLIVYIFLYPLTFLMISSNFLVVSEFWFCLFYIISRSRMKYNE